MSILVPLNGQNYIIPEPNETGWGKNLDNFFVAISNGVLQATGGSFTLSADTDFGPSFGLKSLYYKSRATHPSSTGQIRLGSAETLSWRNAANGADLPLTADASDKLAFNGTVLVYAAGTGLSKSNETLSLSVPVSVANGGTGDIALTAYSVLCGGTTTTGAVQSVSGVGASGQVLTSNGASSLPTWQNVAGSGTVNSGTANQLAYYASSTNVVSGLTAITASRALASDANGLPVAATTTATELGYVNGVTSAIQTQLNLLAPKASPTFTGTVTAPTCDVTTISHVGGTAILGTNTNDSAAAGYVGQVLEATYSAVALPSTGQWEDATSLSLTAGDWLVTHMLSHGGGAPTATTVSAGISTTSGNSNAGLTDGVNVASVTQTSGNRCSLTIADYHVQLASTVVHYAKAFATYSGGTQQLNGRLTAVRIR